MAGRIQTRAEPGPSLPAFRRLGAPAERAEFVAVIESDSRPGDIVVDLHGRGGWVARAAIGELRRAASLESDPLARLLAEVVLRPPDVRHLDAAFQAIAGAPYGDSTLRAAIGQTYASGCATCGRAVVLDELIWDARVAPVRRHYRCPSCRDLPGHGVQRHALPDAADLELAAAFEPFAAARASVRERFPIPAVLAGATGPTRDGDPEGEAPEAAAAADEAAVQKAPARGNPGERDGGLVDQLLDLHTPRQLAGLAAILARIEGELRAPQVTAGLRLALLHALLPASRLNAYPGRMASLRIAGGRLRLPTGAQWRERNPWLAFEDGYRLVRGFVQRLEGGGDRVGPNGRFGVDLRSLGEGVANVVVALSSAEGHAALAAEAATLRASQSGPRIRLVLGQPPLPWTPDRLGTAYYATAWVLGRAAASLLPVDQVFGGPAPNRWEWQAASLRASLSAVAPAVAADGKVVFLLGSSPPEGLVAVAAGGVAAGYHLVEARTASASGSAPAAPSASAPAASPSGDDAGDGVIAFVPPGAPAASRARTRANVPLPPLGRPTAEDLAGAADAAASAEATDVDEAPTSERAFARRTAEVITQTAVEILQARGEPAGFERLLGEILVGLDRSGHLRRLAVRGAPAITAAEHAAAPLSQVESLLALIRGELTRPDNRRLVEAEPGQWWLASPVDRAVAAAPLADRVEWAVFGLLATAGRLSEAAFYDRMAGMFRGHDLPDEALLRACLDSYRLPTSGPDLVLPRDSLQHRSEEHDELIAGLADLGHRLGMDVWIGRKAQGRKVHGRPLATWLDEHERRAYIPLASRSAVDAIEDVDCIWYVRGKASLLFEVEWTAMLGEPVLRRHSRIATDDQVVRFLVVLPERVGLIRHKLASSPLLRRAVEEGNWHFIKAPHVRSLGERETFSLADFEPYLGLEPVAERAAEQLPLFG